MKEKLLRPPIRVGDIIGFTGYNRISAGVVLGSLGVPFYSLSHVGIIGECGGEKLLFESSTLGPEPCVIQGKTFDGTKAVCLDDKLAGYKGRAWHYPLYRSLYEHESKRLNEFLISHVGISYDKIGAFRAGGFVFSWIQSWFRDQDFSRLFCSEYCAAAYADIGLFNSESASMWSPCQLVHKLRSTHILKKPKRLVCGQSA